MLLILRSFLKKVASFLKKYWQYIAIFFAGIAATLWFKRRPSDDDDATTSRDAHDKQLDAIDDVRKDERTKTDAASEKLEKDLANVQRQYEENKKELDEKKKKEIKSILEKHQDDPVALAKRLSETTGFKIIMPEE